MATDDENLTPLEALALAIRYLNAAKNFRPKGEAQSSYDILPKLEATLRNWSPEVER